jgi:CubicO group peptidase (beta-lactamase class C family)
VIFGLLAVFFGGTAAADETPAIVEGALGGELDELLTGCAEWGFSGSVLVARDDTIILRKGYGFAERVMGVPNTPDTLFEIASCSKSITAAAILKLEESGDLSTDDSIAEWLPGVPPKHEAVTIGHLLAHTSGFPRMGPAGSGPDPDLALDGYLAGDRVRDVGADYEYWNGGYALLGMIIERVSGQRLEQFCRERLFEPAGMTATGFCQEKTHDAALLAMGYANDWDVGLASAHTFGWEYRGMGGVVTNVVDMYKWSRALNEGKVLRSTEKLETPGPTGYACGAWIEPTPAGKKQFVIAGNVAGFNSAVWRMPDERAVVIVLCNTSSHAMPVGLHLTARLFGRRGMLPKPPRTVQLDDAALGELCGTFVSDAGRIRIAQLGQGVLVEGEGQPVVQMLMQGDPAVPAHVQSGIDRARKILDGVMAGDYGPFREAMSPDIPPDWPDRFPDYWREHVVDHGKVESVELVGALATAMSPSSLRVLFRLQQADSTRASTPRSSSTPRARR